MTIASGSFHGERFSTHKINNFPAFLQIFPQEWIVYTKFMVLKKENPTG